jgi:tRNA threonylcarbamoyladenosine biosynthesis protein TsaB
VYLSRYAARADRMERLWEYLALAPRVAAERLDPPVILIGNGAATCLPHLPPLGADVRVAPPALSLPSAAAVGQLGHAMLLAGSGVSGDELAPLYLRASEAELKARHG